MWRSADEWPTGGSPVIALIEAGSNTLRYLAVCERIWKSRDTSPYWRLEHTDVNIESTGFRVICWKQIDWPEMPSDDEIAEFSTQLLINEMGYRKDSKENCND